MEYRIIQKEYVSEIRQWKVFVPQVKVYKLPNKYESTLNEIWEDIGGNVLSTGTDSFSYYSSFPENIEEAEKLIEEHNQKYNTKVKEDIVVQEYSY